MNSKEFANMCQRVSRFPKGVQGIKINIPDELQVVFDNSCYYPEKYILQFDNKGNPLHYAQIHSLNIHSVRVVPLNELKLKEK